MSRFDTVVALSHRFEAAAGAPFGERHVGIPSARPGDCHRRAGGHGVPASGGDERGMPPSDSRPRWGRPSDAARRRASHTPLLRGAQETRLEGFDGASDIAITKKD